MKGISKLMADVDVEEFVENYVDVERFQGLCRDYEDYEKIGAVLLLNLKLRMSGIHSIN